MNRSSLDLRTAGIWLMTLGLAGCAAEVVTPEPALPVHTVGPAPGLPTGATASPPTPPPTMTAPSAAAAAPGGGKGPPKAPSGSSADDADDTDTEIREAGPMSDTQRAVFRAAARCFEQGLKRGDKMGKGSLAIELTVEEAGKVTQVNLGPAYSSKVKACIEPRLRGVPFPAQAGGGLRVFRYPMNEVTLGEVEDTP